MYTIKNDGCGYDNNNYDVIDTGKILLTNFAL